MGDLMDNQAARALRDTQDAFIRVESWLSQFQEVTLTSGGKEYTVLARGLPFDATGEGEDISRTPWQIIKLENRQVRIYPSAIWDGTGHHVWAKYNGDASTAESFFDMPLPGSVSPGSIWLECEVDDGDDYHGKIVSAEIKLGAAPQFLSREVDKVNLPLATYFLTTPGEFTIDPIRAFAFTLRRFGPPTSSTWDVTPL